MVANILPTDIPSTQGVGSKGQTIYFSESSHVAYQIKGNLSTEHHESKYAVFTHTNYPWGGVKRSYYFFFSKSGHVAYQIKADEAGSNMVANILPTDTPSTQGVGSKGHTIYFSESGHVAYQIKEN